MYIKTGAHGHTYTISIYNAPLWCRNFGRSSMKTLNCICLTLTIIGAIVWGIIGLFNNNIVDGIFGAGTAFSRIIYTLVGVAGLYSISFYWLFDKD